MSPVDSVVEDFAQTIVNRKSPLAVLVLLQVTAVVFGEKPEVHLFASKAKVEAHVILTCMATDFYPKDIQLWIKRNGRVLRREDGVMSSGLRPNGDETFQRRDWVEILKTDKSRYTCEVIHEEYGMHVEEEWDHKLPENGSPIGVVVGVLVLVLVLDVVAGVLIFCYRKGRICQLTSKKKASDSSSGGSSSASTISSTSSTSSTSSISSTSSSNTGSISKSSQAKSLLPSSVDPAKSQQAAPLNPPDTDTDTDADDDDN